MKILANDGIDAKGKEILEQAGFEVHTDFIPADELMERINDYVALIVRSATKVRKPLLDKMTNTKLVLRAGVGLDNIDLDYAKQCGVTVQNTPAASSNSVAELVMAHMLSCARCLSFTNREMPEHGATNFKELKKSTSNGIELNGKTLGIIGMGRIGRETARMAMGLGMNVIAFDAFIKEAEVELSFHKSLKISNVKVMLRSISKEEVLRNADFISLHIPGGGTTVIGKDELAIMKPGACLINCARGGVVDEVALNEALNTKHLSSAALDVFETEPPVYLDILKHDNISLSPHIGASTVEAQERIGEELASHIITFFKS